MKLNELKHNHSLTDLLKILIFSIIMLTPLLSVASRCMYVICNKNAYQNYSGDLQNTETLTQTDFANMKLSHQYTFRTTQTLTFTNDNYQRINITVNGAKINGTQRDINQLSILYGNNGFRIQTYGNYATDIYSSNSIINIDYVPLEITQNGTINIVANQYNYAITYNYNFYMDNVFEYSISQLENIEYYNWTQNTAVYTGVKAMTTNLQIEGNVIPILITYWFLLTVIYVIIDIVLKCFTTLTHLIGNKKV